LEQVLEGLHIGKRVGIPWLGDTCGVCSYCLDHRENLCDKPIFTGYTRDGGFATLAITDARYAFALGETGSDESLAPLLCAGLSDGARFRWPEAEITWASMGSALPRISLRRW